jgi:isopenicillin N synthase-like dioxygenase
MNLESYPPLFTELNKQAQNNADTFDTMKPILQDSDPIPIIDLQSLNLEQLEEACKDWGFFRLVNHGVPLTLLSQLQDHAKQLYSQSFEYKKAIFTTPTSYFWGTFALNPSGIPLSKETEKINWVEGFNIPLAQLSELQAEDPVLASFRYVFDLLGPF